MPQLTVCIPTFNRAHYLREVLASVLGQSFQDFAILVADDASSDNTREVVASFGDARIKYHRHSQNLGLTANLRKAIEEVDTEFVAVINDDDLMLQDHLETGLHALGAFPAARYYSSPARYFGSVAEGEARPLAISDTTTPLLYLEPEQAVDFLGLDLPGTAHFVGRREVFDHGFYWGPPGFLAPDLLMLTQMMAGGGCVFGNRATTCFRTHAANTSRGAAGAKTRRFNLMVWHGIRWLCDYLVTKEVASYGSIEQHGITSQHDNHVVPLVLALASFDGSTVQRSVAGRIFAQRADMDQKSARFRFARRWGDWTLPVLERLTQYRLGWSPEGN